MHPNVSICVVMIIGKFGEVWIIIGYNEGRQGRFGEANLLGKKALCFMGRKKDRSCPILGIF